MTDTGTTLGIGVAYALLNVHPLTAAQEAALKPQHTFKECTDCPEMIVVPAGSFMMGSAPGQLRRETQRHHRQAVCRSEIRADIRRVGRLLGPRRLRAY